MIEESRFIPDYKQIDSLNKDLISYEKLCDEQTLKIQELRNQLDKANIWRGDMQMILIRLEEITGETLPIKIIRKVREKFGV